MAVILPYFSGCLKESFCMNRFILLTCVLALTACGYKGDLYLPKENDKNQFGVIQTGLDFTPNQTVQPTTPSEPTHD